MMALTNAAYPVLSLVDVLDDQQWVNVAQLVKHTKRSGKLYDGRSIHAKRLYLQCCLASDQIFAKQASFISGQVQAYYAMLLRSPTAVESGKKAAAYRLSLKDGSKDPVLAISFGSVAPKPKALPPPIDDDICGDDDGKALAIADGPPSNIDGDADGVGDVSDKPSVAAGSSSNSSNSSSSSSSDEKDGDERVSFPRRVFGPALEARTTQ
jgi:hypothetical protein